MLFTQIKNSCKAKHTANTDVKDDPDKITLIKKKGAVPAKLKCMALY